MCPQTTAAAQSFFIAMSLNPCVQRKAQDELDRVVGPHRLPEFSDHDNLIYIQAVVLESMRWMTVAPIGVPHCVTRDDEYKGYHIPKDTTVLPVSTTLSGGGLDLNNIILFRIFGENIDPNLLQISSKYGFCTGLCSTIRTTTPNRNASIQTGSLETGR